tara:strand:+ start:624 stop:1835 length:1212 start_codon:yes stop_codon:yes gene_type:complete
MSTKTKEEGSFKIKSKKPKQLSKEQEQPVKVNFKEPLVEVPSNISKVIVPKELINPETNAVQGEPIESLQDTGAESPETREETKVAVPQPVSKTGDNPSPLQEITNEKEEEVKVIKEDIAEAKRDEKVLGKALPENIEKLVSFMEETGGSVEDYVRLNADYTTVDNNILLHEYYKKSKPHLDSEDVSLLLEDFEYDEELDEVKEIRKKKIAFKEEVAKATTFLEDLKDKYYEEIKLRPGITQDQQKATDFFNRYTEDQKTSKAQHDEFLNRTKNLFNDDFKGFDFNVGDKKFRYSVKNASQVGETQSDISNFTKTFLNDKGEINDEKGYHKAIYSARNADTLAQHFYEQGKADAVKEVVTSSKNISNKPRQAASGDVFVGGIRVKAVTGIDSSRLKIKTNKFN